MGRFDIALNKETAPVPQPEQSETQSAKLTGGRVLLIRGPEGYSAIIPIRFMEVKIGKSSGTRTELILSLPNRDAKNIADDIQRGQRKILQG